MITTSTVKTPAPLTDKSMRATSSLLAAALSLTLALASHAQQSLQMPRIFQDGMVLQRGQPIALWGWSRPRADVVARLASTSGHARADANGAWRLDLASRPAGGPLRLVVSAGTESLVFSNVLIGDVWVASGQSNMEFEVTFAANASETVASANDSTVREFKVPNSWANAPDSDLAGGSWLPADSWTRRRVQRRGLFLR